VNGLTYAVHWLYGWLVALAFAGGALLAGKPQRARAWVELWRGYLALGRTERRRVVGILEAERGRETLAQVEQLTLFEEVQK